MKKISAEKSKNFVVNQDFINGDEPSFATNLGMDMFELFDYNHEKYRDFILAVYKPKNVKAFAKQVFASVQDRMEEYFK
jgi:hypothetical protein